jgi:hypothetical protein
MSPMNGPMIGMNIPNAIEFVIIPKILVAFEKLSLFSMRNENTRNPKLPNNK